MTTSIPGLPNKQFRAKYPKTKRERIVEAIDNNQISITWGNYLLGKKV